MSVTGGGGGTGYTYSWSPAANLSSSTVANPVFTPTTGGIYTYTVTVTNSSGCDVTETVTFCVKDIRVPGAGNSGKVYMCHVPNGNTANANTLAVSVNAVASHLSGHDGDKLGTCDQTCTPLARTAGKGNGMIGEDIKIYPNPNNGSFTIELPYLDGNKAQIMVTDVQGKMIDQREVTENTGHKISFNLGAASGMYFVDVTIAGQRFRTKLVVQ
jgi:PKD repeat protein